MSTPTPTSPERRCTLTLSIEQLAALILAVVLGTLTASRFMTGTLASQMARKVEEILRPVLEQLAVAPAKAAHEMAQTVTTAMREHFDMYVRVIEEQSKEFRPYWQQVQRAQEAMTRTQEKMVEVLIGAISRLEHMDSDIKDIRRSSGNNHHSG